MPGLIGFVKKNQKNCSKILSSMRDLLIYRDFYIKDSIFEDSYICASRVHKGIEQPLPQPLEYKGTYLWFNGELFRDCYTEISDLTYFLDLYQKDGSMSFLRNLNGVYNAVLYDSNKKKVCLITDMFGMKPLYWTYMNNIFTWSSEVKCLALAPWISPEIDKTAVSTFLYQGYLTDNNTWFSDISMVPHATIITYDIESSEISKEKYWDFSDVITGKKGSDDELIEEMGYLLKSATNRCMQSKHRYGISVSGGLDSRAILAMSPEIDTPIHSYTFGKRGCIDESIAKKVSAIKNAEFHFFELSEINWLRPRLEGVWFTDGQTNLMHMHGIEFLSEMKKYFDVELNGFIGDAVLGGSLSGGIPYRVSFLNRIRRFVRANLELTELEMHARMPFVDREVMLFSLAIQPYLKKRWRLYIKMLMKFAPEFYRSIPWEKTGLPISIPYPLTAAKIFSIKASIKMKSVLKLPSKKSSYSDYPQWLRKDPAVSFIKKILLDKNCLHKEFIDHSQVTKTVKEHLCGKNNSFPLCLYMTFEIWLRQIYNKEFRN